MLDQRGRLLLVTLTAAHLPLPTDMPVVQALHGWLDSWRGIGAIEAGMARQGYDLQLARTEDEWAARFEGREHVRTSMAGNALDATPWRAVREAARRTLELAVKEAEGGPSPPAPRGGPAAYVAPKRRAEGAA